MAAQLSIPVTEASQVGDVRRHAMRLAQSIDLPAERCSDAGIVATELATNLFRHARDGQVWIQVLRSGGRDVLEVMAVDAGPGMADLSRCLSDGYSSAGTSGTGFGAVRRLSDEFDAYSNVGKGSVVLARLGARGRHVPTRYQVGAVSLCAPHEAVCGDSWRVEESGSEVAILVADGLGHGPMASEAAERAATVFASQPFAPSSQFFEHAHKSLGGSRGAAVARAIIRDSGRVEYSSVGNIAATLLTSMHSKGLASQNGTVGAEMRRQIDSFAYDWPADGLFLMHSDGVTGRWSLGAYPGLIVRHPAVVAGVLCRDFIRGRDDATVVVVARHRNRHD